jgi:hypothetical protein
MGKFIKSLKVYEVGIPIIILIIVFSILGVLFFENFPLNKHYNVIASISGSLVGFLITSLSLIYVFPNEGRIIRLKKLEIYQKILFAFVFGIIFQLILFFISLIGMFFGTLIHFQNTIFLVVFIVSMYFLLFEIWVLKRLIDLTFVKEKKYLKGKDIDF